MMESWLSIHFQTHTLVTPSSFFCLTLIPRERLVIGKGHTTLQVIAKTNNLYKRGFSGLNKQKSLSCINLFNNIIYLLFIRGFHSLAGVLVFTTQTTDKETIKPINYPQLRFLFLIGQLIAYFEYQKAGNRHPDSSKEQSIINPSKMYPQVKLILLYRSTQIIK